VLFLRRGRREEGEKWLFISGKEDCLQDGGDLLPFITGFTFASSFPSS
jgi:hypothetical protein